MLLDMATDMVIKLGVIIIFAPLFLGPSIVIAILGSWLGQVYIAAQLPVRREMSIAKSPVLGQ